MLLDIRETVRNSKPLKYTLITIICIPFVLFGVGSYFSGGGAGYAAKVDGVEISGQEFDQAYSQQRARLAQMFGGQIPAGFADETAIRQQALDGLLTQQVLRNTVADHKFTVSDTTLAKAIQDVPAFQNEGSFDKERYVQQLRSNGMSVDQFEYSFREDTALAQFRSGVVDTSFSLAGEQQRADALTNQIRLVDTLTFPIDAEIEAAEVSDEEIQSRFDTNADSYEFPERTKIRYLLLDAAELATDIEIDDADAEQYFEDNRSAYLVPEERKASHILLSLDEDASAEDLEAAANKLGDIQSRIEAGESFADLAKEFSDDPGSAETGGSLGAIAPGVMVPEFEAAVFSLAEAGQLSDQVRTDFGLHLIKLDEIVAERGKSFEEVKDEIRSTMQTRQANDEFLDLSDALTEQSFDNPESLEAAADATGLEIIESGWIDGTADSDPAVADPAILAAAMSEDVKDTGNNSEVIELGPQRVIVLRSADYEGPRPKTIDDVREQLLDEIKAEKAGAVLDEAVAGATTQLQEGGAIVDIAEAAGGVAATDLKLSLQSADVDRQVVSRLFELVKPAADKPVLETVTLANGDRVLTVFRGIGTPEDAESATEGEANAEASVAEAPKAGADPHLGTTEFTLLLDTLRANSEIETNDVLFDQSTYQ